MGSKLIGALGSLVLCVTMVGCSGASEDQQGVLAEQPSGEQTMKDRGMSQEEIDSRAKAPR